MPKGIVGGLYGERGQVLSEGNVYNFNIDIVSGCVTNKQEVEFELENGRLKVVYGDGAKKPTVVSAPVKAPAPAPVPPQKNIVNTNKENSISKLLDTRDLLTEEK